MSESKKKKIPRFSIKKKSKKHDDPVEDDNIYSSILTSSMDLSISESLGTFEELDRAARIPKRSGSTRSSLSESSKKESHDSLAHLASQVKPHVKRTKLDEQLEQSKSLANPLANRVKRDEQVEQVEQVGSWSDVKTAEIKERKELAKSSEYIDSNTVDVGYYPITDVSKLRVGDKIRYINEKDILIMGGYIIDVEHNYIKKTYSFGVAPRLVGKFSWSVKSENMKTVWRIDEHTIWDDVNALVKLVKRKYPGELEKYYRY